MAVLLLVACAVQFLLPSAAAAAAAPLPIIAVLPGPGQTSLVVDVGADAKPVATDRVSVTVRDVPQRTTVQPVFSSRLAVALVVDASAAGAPGLPGWASAAARFALEAPTGTRAALIADTTPPTAVVPLQRGPMEIVRTLSDMRARGERSTSAALTLAVTQLPAAVADPRVIVLYTEAADAGGESAAALAKRLTGANVILVVVGPARDAGYWSGVSRATGGFHAPVLAPLVVPALEQVTATLRGRYLVTIPTPGQLPARASVRIDTGDDTQIGDAVIPVASATRNRSGAKELPVPVDTLLSGVAVAAVLAYLVTAGALIWRRTSSRPPPRTGNGYVPGAATPTVARRRSRVLDTPQTQRPGWPP